MLNTKVCEPYKNFLMKDPVLVAKDIRRKLSKGANNPNRLILRDTLRLCNILITEYPFHSNNINALCFKHNGIFTIGVNLNRKHNERNFITAHEIGHILLHQKPFSLNLENEHCLSRNRFSALDNQANTFAAELLMPEEVFREKAKSLDMAKLVEHFDVHENAVIFRIKLLSLSLS